VQELPTLVVEEEVDHTLVKEVVFLEKLVVQVW
jgi:hypothetical protein